jgi:hypothetical protein
MNNSWEMQFTYHTIVNFYILLKHYLTPQHPRQQSKLSRFLSFCLEVKSNLLRNNRQEYSALYFCIYVVRIIWEYKILPAKMMRIFREIYLFLFSYFM